MARTKIINDVSVDYIKSIYKALYSASAASTYQSTPNVGDEGDIHKYGFDAFLEKLMSEVTHDLHIVRLYFFGNENVEAQMLVFGMKRSESEYDRLDVTLFDVDVINKYPLVYFGRTIKPVTDMNKFMEDMIFNMSGGAKKSQ